MRDTVFVTGGSSLVGRLLIARLAARGTRVIALARSAAAVEVVRDAGAEPVFGDVAAPEAWHAEAGSADRVFHLARPRLNPPVRARRIGGLVREASAGAAGLRALLGAGRPVTVASTGLVYGDRPSPAAEDDTPAPVALARPARATETALADVELRMVRLGWVYGEEGIFFDLLHALRARRLRVLGAGNNRWALVAASDAADALLIASSGPPGIYSAAEADAPTQFQVIQCVCEATGLQRPDHLPARMASLSFGGAMVEALMASTALRTDRLAALGWRPRCDWRRDLPALLGVSTRESPRPEG